jgi:hypothetical protein
MIAKAEVGAISADKPTRNGAGSALRAAIHSMFKPQTTKLPKRQVAPGSQRAE